MHTKKREKILITQLSHLAYRKLVIKHWMWVPCYIGLQSRWMKQFKARPFPEENEILDAWLDCLKRFFWPLFWNQSTVNTKADMRMKAIYQSFSRPLDPSWVPCLLYTTEHGNSLDFRIREARVQHLSNVCAIRP